MCSSCPSRPSRVVERGQPWPSHEHGLFPDPPRWQLRTSVRRATESSSRRMGICGVTGTIPCVWEWEMGDGQSSLTSDGVRRISVQDTPSAHCCYQRRRASATRASDTAWVTCCPVGQERKGAISSPASPFHEQGVRLWTSALSVTGVSSQGDGAAKQG